MRNEKIAQAKEAAKQILAGLQPGEFFNVIDYSDSISSFASQPIAVDTASLDRAATYISQIEANGGTNLHQALLEATRPAAQASHLPIILFLTDGLPTVGERDEARIREAVMTSNKAGRRIFPFGVGFDVNVPLLTRLAESSRGAPTFVLPSENVETKVSQVYRRLKGPVLSAPNLTSVNLGGASRVADLMPRVLGDVFEGDQIIVMGTYRATSDVVLSLSGDYFGKQLTWQIPFDPRKASYTNSFVPRLWAERKVASLIDEIRQAGAEGVNTNDPRIKELIDEIVRLSTKFGILTEYTAFLATEKEKFKDADGDGLIDHAASRAADNLSDLAVRQRWGTGAVRQQMDLEAKQSALRAPSNAYYMNENLQRQEVTNVLYYGDLAFFMRNNRWIDSRLLTDEDAKPDSEIRFGSTEYFELAQKLASSGRQNALTFDKDAVILVDQKRILIRR
jgi:Ca-activated chloride channel family protein